MKIRIRFTNKLFVLISIIFIHTMQYSSAQTSTAPAVGNTTVSADVGSLGNATATIPIYCPPARLGIKPSINLTFNSQGNSGVLGKGWNITGMSVITRTGRNWHLDNGVQEGITLTNNDKLALDGQRLMLIEDPLNLSTTPLPFINVDNNYRTEQDQFVKVTYRDGDYFEVDLKGGGKAFYGKISNSKHIPIGSSQTLSWYISRSYDKNGNYIEYEYDNSGGQIFLSEIRYGGYDCTLFNTKSSGWAAQGTFNKVVFSQLATSHTSQQYVAGFEIKQNKIISKIETFTNNTTLVRIYNMVYETDNISTRLTQINEQIGSSNKMHPVGITWQEDEPIDIVTRTVSGPVATNAGNNVVKKMGDFNGDGKTDILIINGELKPSKNRLLNKTNTFSFKTVSANGNLIDLPILVNNYTIYYDNLPYDNISEVLIGDVDADGDDDIIFQTLSIDYSTGQKSCGNLTFDIYILNSMTYHYNLYKSNSNFNLKTPQFDKQDNYYPSRSINFNIDFISFQNEVTEYALVIPMLVEADGDGFLDLLENETKRNRNLIEQDCEATTLGELAYNQIHIYLSTLVNEPILTNRYYNHPANIPQLVSNRIVPMDFNGNGKTDFMFSFEQSNTTSIFEYNNETKAFKHIYGTGQYGFPTKWHKFIQTGDFNGDGETDLLYFVNDNWMIAYSTGLGYEEKNATNLWFSNNYNPDWCYSHSIERSGFNFYIADFNGDGKDDILERHNHGTDGMNTPTHSADGLYIYYSQGLGFIKTNINGNEPCNTCTNTRYSLTQIIH